MKNKFVKVLLKYSITSLFCAGLVILTLYLQNYFTLETTKERIRLLADAFTIPGVVVTLFGVFVWLVNEGALTGLGYIGKHVLQMLIPFIKKDTQTYREYVASRKKITGYSFLAITGGVFLVVAVVFTIIYYCI